MTREVVAVLPLHVFMLPYLVSELAVGNLDTFGVFESIDEGARECAAFGQFVRQPRGGTSTQNDIRRMT